MTKTIQQGKASKPATIVKNTISKKAQTGYKKAPVRLWVKSKFLSFRRSRELQSPNQALLKIEGVNDTEAAKYYFGKRCVYIYKAPSTKQGTKFRTIWGRICKAHGMKGVVIARFNPNLPARAMGSTIRVMLFPQHN